MWKSAGRAPSLRIVTWHLPYNWGKRMEKPQSGYFMFYWFFYHCVYGWMFCTLLFNSVSYTVCILIVMFMYSCCYISSVLYILFSTCQLAFFGYPEWVFSVLFLQLQGKYQGLTRKYRARPALFPINKLYCSMYCLWRMCCSMYCLCVNVYCTTATACQPNCSKQIHISYPIISKAVDTDRE
jgi:hypothetical protein